MIFHVKGLLQGNNISISPEVVERPAKNGVSFNGREYKNIIIIHSEKFVSDYQGRIYVDNILEVYDENNNIRIDRMLEFVSEMFREYWINKEKVKEQYPEYYLLIEESIK